LYESETEALRSKTTNLLSATVARMERFSSNQRYFHILFKKIFNLAQKSAEPQKFLEANIRNLKKRYPGSFDFIVWNKNGKILEKLTDQQGLKFVLSCLYSVLESVSKQMKDKPALPVSDNEIFKKYERLISHYLGRFFIPESLKTPYQKGLTAGPAKVGFSDERSDFWYQTGNEVSFLVFFNKHLLERKHYGLETFLKAFKSHQPEVCAGYVKGSNPNNLPKHVPEHLQPDLIQALARFSNFSPPIIETQNTITIVKISESNLFLFAMAEKRSELWNPSLKRNKTLYKVSALILIFYLICYMRIFVMKAFISVKTKLLSVFLFANLVPIMLLMFIGLRYLQSRSTLQIENYRNKSFENLMSLDRQLEILIEQKRQKLVKLCQKVNTDTRGINIDPITAGSLEKEIRKFEPDEAYLISSAGQKLFEFYKDDKQPQHSNTFTIPMMLASLNYLNGIIIKADKSDYVKFLQSPETSEPIRQIVKYLGEMYEISAGNRLKIAYQFAFGNLVSPEYNYFMLLLWNKKSLAQSYISTNILEKSKLTRQSSIFVRSVDGSFLKTSTEAKFSLSTQNFLEKVIANTITISKIISINNQPHLAVGIKGRELEDTVIAEFVPLETVIAQTATIRNYIILAIVMNFGLAIAISLFLSKQFMKPLTNLQDATLALGKRNFRYRMKVLDLDELGYLSLTFNQVMEGLGELEVARIVQESLFPGNNFKAGDYDIYGESRVMTSLGGDYYDCFAINDQFQTILIGDVAGHGVPAGLIMAMARSTVVSANEEQLLDPVEMIKRLHLVFSSIKNEKMKRMMTFQYFVLDLKNHEFTYTNAGHCFPIIVDPEKRQSCFLTNVHPPLGLKLKPRHKNHSFKLEPGQSLIVYTDGIAEATNKNGEQYGFDRLKNNLPNLYDSNPESFFKNLVSVYENWVDQVDDDLTILITTRDKK
jgi:hypothetical protein